MSRRTQSRRRAPIAPAAFALIFMACPALAQSRTNVAVFNFQMKSQTSDWVWLEKGLADQITTDFIRCSRLSVIARDDMQSAADKVKWTPELLADEKGMVELKKALTVESLVTGVYSVKGEQISITAQVVQMSTREVKDREEVTGKAADVLELQRRLSAKLVAYFTGAPEEKVLPELPVWTKSVPATRALYEGMDLYDQGRYGEAWLRFRQASKDDGGYMEAQYWVARMYYFMDRYEHARRAYERFVYMDQDHPRLGDAIKEYLATYENLGAPLDVLTSLYEDLGRRYPDAKIFNELGGPGPLPNQAWLQAREAMALYNAGHWGEAAELTGKAIERIHGYPYFFTLDVMMTASIRTYNNATGRVLLPESYARVAGLERLAFRDPQSNGDTDAIAELALKSPVGPGGRVTFYLLAPDGYFFKKVHLAPVSDNGADATFSFWNWQTNDIPPDGNGAPKGPDERPGQMFSNMPRLGLVRVSMTVKSGKGQAGAAKAIRAEARLSKLGPHGTICRYTSTMDAAVGIDGFPSWGPAPVAGMIPPGEYAVRLSPFDKDSPFGTCQVKAAVRDGHVTPLVARMPWKPGSPFEAWTQCDTQTIPAQMGTQAFEPKIRFFLEEKAIHAIIHFQGDLWTMDSTDGNTFTRPAKIPLPVSTAWSELSPVCIRDESGRAMLMFRSDRDAQRQFRLYLSWSRDFQHWSAPSQVVPHAVLSYDFVQDPQGRFVLVETHQGKVAVLQSRDAYRWEEIGAVRSRGGPPQYVRLLSSSKGFDLLISTDGGMEHYTSIDARDWTYAGRAGDGTGLIADPSLERTAGGLVGAITVGVGKLPDYWHNFVQIFRQKSDGAWEQSKPLPGFLANGGAMSYHPRWGYVMAWVANCFPLVVDGQSYGGCYVLIVRGQSMDAFFRTQPPATQPTK